MKERVNVYIHKELWEKAESLGMDNLSALLDYALQDYIDKHDVETQLHKCLTCGFYFDATLEVCPKCQKRGYVVRYLKL